MRDDAGLEKMLLQGAVMAGHEDVSLELEIGLDDLLVENVQVVPFLFPCTRARSSFPLNVSVPHHKQPTQLLPSEAIRDGEQ